LTNDLKHARHAVSLTGLT